MNRRPPQGSVTPAQFNAHKKETTALFITDINVLDNILGQLTISNSRLSTYLNSNPNVELYFPPGTYYVSAPITFTTNVSLKLHKDATIKTLGTIDYMFNFTTATVPSSLSQLAKDQSITGGVIDGDNKVNKILKLNNYWHFSLKDLRVRNAIQIGITTFTEGVNPAELVIDNLYLQNINSTNYSNNTGLQLNSTDNHIHNLFVVDFSTGVEINASANFVNKAHVWISDPNRLPYTTGFKVNTNGVGYFNNCFADTMQTGFYNNQEMFLDTCVYSNNTQFTFTTAPNAIFLDAGYTRIHASNCTFNGQKSVSQVVTPNVVNITSGLLGEGFSNSVYLNGIANTPQDQIKNGVFSFTPTIVGDVVLGTPTYIAQSGRFTRVGTLVHCDISIKATLDNTISGNIQIRGLPYASAWNSNISIGYRSGFGSNLLFGSVDSGTTHIFLLRDSNVLVGADALRGTLVEIYVTATYLTTL